MDLSQLPISSDIVLAAGCNCWVLDVEILLEGWQASEVRPGEMDVIQISAATCTMTTTVVAARCTVATRCWRMVGPGAPMS